MTEVGYDSDTAWAIAQKMDALEPPAGKTVVTALQKSRVIVDNVKDNPQRLAALAEFVDEGMYNKLEIGYQSGVDPLVYVFFKEQAEKVKARTGKDSLTQGETTAVLRSIKMSDKERAVLWQLQNTGWKPGSNPFDRATGQRVYGLYQQRKKGK